MASWLPRNSLARKLSVAGLRRAIINSRIGSGIRISGRNVLDRVFLDYLTARAPVPLATSRWSVIVATSPHRSSILEETEKQIVTREKDASDATYTSFPTFRTFVDRSASRIVRDITTTTTTTTDR